MTALARARGGKIERGRERKKESERELRKREREKERKKKKRAIEKTIRSKLKIVDVKT